jgi:hypothetical protein
MEIARMKYKLLKDLPGYKAGTLFVKESPVDYWYEVDGETETILNDSSWIGHLLLLHDPKFFQPIDDKPERWRAEEHDYFYYIDEYGDIEQDRERRDAMAVPEMTDKIYRYGNYFRTEQQAQKAAEAIRAVLGYIQTPAETESAEYWRLRHDYQDKAYDARLAVQTDEEGRE